MDLQLAIDNLKNPNDKFDLDLIAIRVVVLHLLSKQESVKADVANGLMQEPAPDFEDGALEPKKWRKKKCLA